MERLAVFAELLRFVRRKRVYWMLPTIVTLLVIGFLIVVSEGSALAPFIYPLF